MEWMFKRNRGFNLPELIVIMAVILLLSAVVLANVNSARKKARDAQRMSDLDQLQVAFRLYKDVNNAYPSSPGLIEKGSTVQDSVSEYLTGEVEDPFNEGNSRYYFDNSYNCGGARAVLVALTMELPASKNYADVCGTSYEAIVAGATPSANSYIVILK